MILALGACAANAPTRDESGAGANTEPSLAGQSTEKPSAENEPERAGVNEASFAQTPEELPEEEVPAEEPEHTSGGTLIAYFSCTGTTKAAAEQLAALIDADLYEIVPEKTYTSDDLDYNSDCRANREQNDPDARPAISGEIPDLSEYDTILLGYPIWWGQAPKIVYTFLESYDFSGKTITPFCTSASSGIGGSLAALQALAPDANWLDGRRFAGGDDASDLKAWVDGLDFTK